LLASIAGEFVGVRPGMAGASPFHLEGGVFMRTIRITAALVALTVGIATGAPPKQAVAGTQQCYHRFNEPADGCSMCANTCLGDGYVCCTIVVG
jgi:hypothetical protein